MNLRVSSFLLSSPPQLYLHQAGLFTSPASSIALKGSLYSSHEETTYKFIVDGRWMTKDVEPTEVDPGFIIDVYATPPMPVPP